MTLLLNDLILLPPLLWFFRWRLWHLWSRVAPRASSLRSFCGLARHIWVPQAAFILSLPLVFGCWLCAPLAQWKRRTLATGILWCTGEPRHGLLRTWESGNPATTVQQIRPLQIKKERKRKLATFRLSVLSYRKEALVQPYWALCCSWAGLFSLVGKAVQFISTYMQCCVAWAARKEPSPTTATRPNRIVQLILTNSWIRVYHQTFVRQKRLQNFMDIFGQCPCSNG